MLVAGFPAGAFAANCYLIASGPGQECLIIDPGQDAVPGIEDILREHRLRPAAVLATHGHIDHVWSVAPVCGAKGIAAYIHPSDRALLSDPARGLGLPGQQLLRGLTFSEPDDVRELADGMTLELAGIRLVVDHAPGHTPGSVTFRLPGGGGPGTLFSGDLLFAGSIGRSDLPGGNYGQILDSLARVCLPLPDDTAVLAGHGPGTTIGAERAANPFLAGLDTVRQQPPGHTAARPPGHTAARRHAAASDGPGQEGRVSDDPHPRGGYAARCRRRHAGHAGGLGRPPSGPRRRHVP